MNRPIRWYDYITINIFWLGLTSLSQTMTPLVIPLLVQQFVGEGQKGAYYGMLRLWALMTALLVQALMGMLSDHSTLRWGKRRPFIFIGTLAVCGVVIAIGGTSSMQGLEGYWTLFALALLMMTAINTAHGAQQGLIPDLVPLEKRGRFSGIKAVLEVPLPVILVSMTIAKLVSKGNLWGGLGILIGILLVTMLLTMVVPEKPRQPSTERLEWAPLIRLIAMTGIFTAAILLMGAAARTGSALLVNSVSATGLIIMTGVLGLLCMLVAIGLGVWFSIRAGLGIEAQQNRSYIFWVINRLAFLVGSTNIASFTVYFLQGRLGYVREQAAGPAATLTMFVGVFILFSALPSGWLTDRFGSRKLVGLSCLIAAAGTAVAVAVPSLGWIYAGASILGAGIGLFYAANWALGTEIVPPDQAGRFLGISNLAGAGAGAIGAYIGGPLADLVSTAVPQHPGVGYVMLFVVYGLLFLFSLAALLGVKQNFAK